MKQEKKRNFTMMPNKLLLNPLIDDRAKVLYMLLRYFENISKEKVAKIGLRKLCTYSSVKNPNTMKKLGDILKTFEWIEISKDENGRCNRYITHFENSYGENLNEDGSMTIEETKPSHDLRPNNINKNIDINSSGEFHGTN